MLGAILIGWFTPALWSGDLPEEGLALAVIGPLLFVVAVLALIWRCRAISRRVPRRAWGPQFFGLFVLFSTALPVIGLGLMIAWVIALTVDPSRMSLRYATVSQMLGPILEVVLMLEAIA